ncbi:MAG: SOS response-associated peptidase [Paludibacter sp.]|nr:SOS response-associated peptidase [Paludibacter sp.]
MCFTVAIIRNGVLMTAEQYYNGLPAKIRKKKKNPIEPEIPNLYMVSGFAHPKLPVITDNEIVLKEWGLIPSWAKSKDDAFELRDKTLNAKGETIYEKPSFSQNILSRRCLLPVSGFFEWRDFNNNKYPYFIEPTNDPGFLLGSVFDTWLDKSTGEVYDTFSIVTTAANPLMEMIHNVKKRMPLILDLESADKWLNPLSTPEQIKSLILPYEEINMRAHTISKVAGNSKVNRNYSEILEPVDYPELNQQSLF